MRKNPALPPRRVRLLYGLKADPRIMEMTNDQLRKSAEDQNRLASSELMRIVTGVPARGVDMSWRELTLPDRKVWARVYRRTSANVLPVVIHVHGGGFAGTAAQCDWINSLLAARLPAVVVSVEHRLLNRDTPLQAAADDAWDVLEHLRENADEWGIDTSRVALAGESCGALIAALNCLKARDAGIEIRAQVLVNPVIDVTETAFDYPTMSEFAESPTLNSDALELFRELAVPPKVDPRPLSPICAEVGRLPPTLLVIPELDPLADQGRSYAKRLSDAGVSVRVSQYPKSGHAFLSMPGLDPAARAAGRGILSFLSSHLT